MKLMQRYINLASLLCLLPYATMQLAHETVAKQRAVRRNHCGNTSDVLQRSLSE
ncbi:hypothetical protein LRM35_24410 [Klebsiella variicola subsp. variicola]|nr:hypothetical protein LRM35_24410 [Klebsiella variicola subsp. variicola]